MGNAYKREVAQDLLEVVARILLLAYECPHCKGTGESRETESGCRLCGGVGELCSCGQEISALRDALAALQ